VVRDSAVAVIVVNEYTPKEVYPVNVEVSGSKILVGRDWNENDAFTFVLQKYAANGSWQQLGNEVTVIKDITPVPHNGCRPPKRRRV
jgi:ribosomal protein S11